MNETKTATSEAQKRAVSKYLKERVETVALRLPIGSKERIKQVAESQNESVNEFIKTAIDQRIETIAGGGKVSASPELSV